LYPQDGLELINKILKLKGRKFYTQLNGVNKNNIEKELLSQAPVTNISAKRYVNQNDIKEIK